MPDACEQRSCQNLAIDVFLTRSDERERLKVTHLLAKTDVGAAALDIFVSLPVAMKKDAFLSESLSIASSSRLFRCMTRRISMMFRIGPRVVRSSSADGQNSTGACSISIRHTQCLSNGLSSAVLAESSPFGERHRPRSFGHQRPPVTAIALDATPVTVSIPFSLATERVLDVSIFPSGIALLVLS